MALVFSLLLSLLISSVHKVQEGNVGIYFKHGALLDEITYPGIHWMAPFVTEVKEVSVRPHTDTLAPVISVTKDGIENRFNEVQVRYILKREL